MKTREQIKRGEAVDTNKHALAMLASKIIVNLFNIQHDARGNVPTRMMMPQTKFGLSFMPLHHVCIFQKAQSVWHAGLCGEMFSRRADRFDHPAFSQGPSFHLAGNDKIMHQGIVQVTRAHAFHATHQQIDALLSDPQPVNGSAIARKHRRNGDATRTFTDMAGLD